jgi:hypothetical protein
MDGYAHRVDVGRQKRCRRSSAACSWAGAANAPTGTSALLRRVHAGVTGLSLVCALLAVEASGQLGATPAPAADTITLLVLSAELSPEPVQPFELFEALGVTSQAADLRALRVTTSRLRADGNIRSQGVRTAPTGAGVSRRLSSVWQARIPANLHPKNLVARYAVVSCSGKPGRLSAVDEPRAEVRIVVQPLPPRILSVEERVVSSAGQPRMVEKTAIVEGGADVVIYPQGLGYGGTFCGRLTVTLDTT